MELRGYCRKTNTKDVVMHNPKVKVIREGKAFFSQGTDEAGNAVVSLISKATFDAAVAAGVPVVE